MPSSIARFVGFCAMLFILFSACNTQPAPPPINLPPETPAPPVFNPASLGSQIFQINPLRDTQIKARSGATIFVPKKSFTDSAGKSVATPVRIEWKEALQPADIVLAGLSTTSNGAILQTGGMVFMNAQTDGRPLQLAAGKEISISIPTRKKDSRMKIFEGVEDSLGINWINPRPMAAASPVATDSSSGPERKIQEQVPVLESDFMVADSLAEADSGAPILNRQLAPAAKGYNYFAADAATQYIFVLKKLGWANIDVLFANPRLSEVQLFTQIDGQADFKWIYITLILPQKNIYLPGYQKKDNSFSFTHGDFETTKLPIGEPAIIIATAYKGEESFYAAQTLTIATRNTVNLKPVPVKAGELKARVSSLFK